MCIFGTSRFLLAICRILCYAFFGATSTPVGGSPRILFGGDILLFAPDRKREGVTAMNITWDEIFHFCTLIVSVINLVLQANNNKKK